MFKISIQLPFIASALFGTQISFANIDTSASTAIITTQTTTVAPLTPLREIRQNARGTNHGGGGDPLANDALKVVEQILEKLKTAKGQALGLRIEAMEARWREIYDSLEGTDPLLVLPYGDLIDCFGAKKLGCFREGRIEIARNGWLNSSGADKVAVSAMEILISFGSPNRYRLAPLILNLFTHEELQQLALRSEVIPIDRTTAYDGSTSFLNIPLGSFFQFTKDFKIPANLTGVTLESTGSGIETKCWLNFERSNLERVIPSGSLFRLDQIAPSEWNVSTSFRLRGLATGTPLAIKCAYVGVLQETDQNAVLILNNNGISIRTPSPRRF